MPGSAASDGPRHNLSFAGTDVARGELVLAGGRCSLPARPVCSPPLEGPMSRWSDGPRVAIVSTGEELIARFAAPPGRRV